MSHDKRQCTVIIPNTRHSTDLLKESLPQRFENYAFYSKARAKALSMEQWAFISQRRHKRNRDTRPGAAKGNSTGTPSEKWTSSAREECVRPAEREGRNTPGTKAPFTAVQTGRRYARPETGEAVCVGLMRAACVHLPSWRCPSPCRPAGPSSRPRRCAG